MVRDRRSTERFIVWREQTNLHVRVHTQMQNATLDVQQSLSVRSLCTIADRRRRCEVCTEYYSTEYTMSVYETLCVCMLNIFDIGKIGSRMHADEKASGNEYEAPPVRRMDAVANVNFSCGAHTF